MANKITEAVATMVEALESLSSEERSRAIQGALAILGEPTQKLNPTQNPSQSNNLSADENSHKPSTAGERWITANKLTQDHLDEAFHIDEGKVSVILSSIPGDGKADQCANVYLLTGVASLLETGKADFSDENARENCRTLGCYDGPNHSRVLKRFGNRITGSKNTGWKLTAPGLTAAAALLMPGSINSK